MKIIRQLGWHLKGSCSWAASILSLAACASLIGIELRRKQAYTKATLYIILIAIGGIFAVLIEQATFLREEVNPRFAPEWIYQLGKITTGSPVIFFENFFPRMLDFLIVSDTVNLYLIICLPNQVPTFLSKKAISAYMAAILAMCSIFAALSVKIYHDRYDVAVGPLCRCQNDAFTVNHPWLYEAIFNMTVSTIVGGFHIFCMIKIRKALKKAIGFLADSHVQSHVEETYRRIRKFCVIIGTLFFLFNFVINLIHSVCKIFPDLVIYQLINFGQNRLIIYVVETVAYAAGALRCLRPCVYCAAYIWLRAERSRN